MERVRVFNIHLPRSVYESLPRIYLGAAGLIALSPMNAFRWIPVAALLLAAWMTVQQRKAHRSRRSGRSQVAADGRIRI